MALLIMAGCEIGAPQRVPTSSEHTSSGPSGSVVLASFEDPEGHTVGSTSITIVDLDDGSSRPASLPGFVSGDAQFKFFLASDYLVFRCDSGACAIDSGLAGETRTLGDAWCMAPSATEGLAWLASLDPDSPNTVRAMATVREVSQTGEVMAESQLPSARWHCPVGAVTQGVIFQENGSLVVWDTDAGEVASRLAGPFPAATHEDLVAWCDFQCDGGLHVSDVASDRDIVIDGGEDWRFEETYNGAFAPDGRSLAVPVRGAGESQVAIVDLDNRSVRLVPNSRLTPYQLMTWSGDWLVFDTGEGYLTAFHRDTEEMTTITVDETQTFFAMVAI